MGNLFIVYGDVLSERLRFLADVIVVPAYGGEMVRYAAEINAVQPEQLKSFAIGQYRFDESRSTDTEYVFIRETEDER